jgi:hypothetical protein
VPPDAIDKVREMLAGDGDLLLQHKGDRRLTTKKAYDEPIQGGPSSQYDPSGRAANLSSDEPPAFPGAPRAGGTMIPLTASADTNRRLALNSAKRTKSWTPRAPSTSLKTHHEPAGRTHGHGQRESAQLPSPFP